MTTAIMAKDRIEARDVAKHLRLQEWRYVQDACVAATLPGRSVVVLSPLSNQHEHYRAMLDVLRARDCQLFEVDAWRDRFMTVALFTKSTRAGDEYLHEERELYVRDEDEAQRLDGKDGWVLVVAVEGRRAYEEWLSE